MGEVYYEEDSCTEHDSEVLMEYGLVDEDYYINVTELKKMLRGFVLASRDERELYEVAASIQGNALKKALVLIGVSEKCAEAISRLLWDIAESESLE